MKQELENKRPDSGGAPQHLAAVEKQNLKDWVWFCKEHPDWLDLDVQTWVSTHIGQPCAAGGIVCGAAAPEPAAAAAGDRVEAGPAAAIPLGQSAPYELRPPGSGSPAAAREPSAQADGCGPSSRA